MAPTATLRVRATLLPDLESVIFFPAMKTPVTVVPAG